MKSATPSELRCSYRTKSGRQCQCRRVHDSSFCAIHEKRVAAMSTEIEFLSSKESLDTAAGIHEALSKTLRALAAGAIAPALAKSITYVCQTMLASVARAKEEHANIRIKSEGEALTNRAIYNTYLEKFLDPIPGNGNSDAGTSAPAPSD